jgi:hypothetical protein
MPITIPLNNCYHSIYFKIYLKTWVCKIITHVALHRRGTWFMTVREERKLLLSENVPEKYLALKQTN